MRDDASTRGSERGQALILMMLVMTVIFAIGAMVVDLGLWLGERRGAQTDADFVALAGAWELLNPNATQFDVEQAANSTLAANQEEMDASGKGTAELANLSINGNCVEADVRHSSVSLFSGIFGLVAPDIGAHAKACAGATNAPLTIVPFEINTGMTDCFESNGTPKFDTFCPLDYGAGGGNPRGILDLDASGDFCSEAGGSGNTERLIVTGISGTCLISESGNCTPVSKGPWYDCVAVQSGNPSQVMRAVRDRIELRRDCDTNPVDGVESLNEVVEVVFSGSPNVYQARDCNPAVDGSQISPRLVSIIVLDAGPTSGNTGYPIRAFAGFYIAGCGSELSPTPLVIDPNCSPGGGGGGHTVVYGRFVNLIVENSATGPSVPSTTSFSISLEE